MTDGPSNEVLQIKKYPNRRFYDATRSCHVTLQEVHDLIMEGHDVCITDSRNGEDITNLVLTQILIERDQPKLDLFPSSILHVMIRSNRQMLRNWMDQFFGPFLGLVSTSQRHWDTYVRNAMQGRFMTPMEWASGMMSSFGRRPSSNGVAGAPEPAEPPADATEIEELRRQMAALKARLDQIGPRNSGPTA
jgi:polyhydroxyalkanoate synthesis repressor PhaR